MTEEHFDREFGPKLLALAQRIKAAGSSFVCYVDFDGGGCRTVELQPVPSAEARLTYLAAACGGNADRLILSMMKDSEKNGHGSVYLKLLEHGKT